MQGHFGSHFFERFHGEVGGTHPRFYGAEGMLYDGLSFPVQILVLCHSPCISVGMFLELASLYDLPVLFGGRA